MQRLRVPGRFGPRGHGWFPGDSLELLWGPLARIRLREPQVIPEGSVEPLWSHLARIGPRGRQMGPRRLCGATLGSPGADRAQRAPDGSQETLWSPFGASWPGSGPGGPRWLPASFVQPFFWSPPGLVVNQSMLYVLRSYANNSTGWLP